MKHLSTQDFALIPLINLRVENLASDPSPGNAGRVFLNTTTSLVKWDNGSAIIDPLNRANHSGTQLASTISNLTTTVQAIPLSSFAAPSANIAMAGNTLTGLPTPTAAGQAAEFSWVIGQVQSAAAGISSKPPVAAVATTNISLSGTQTIDGVALVAGQRVLVTGQTTASQNGVYVVSSGAWSRAQGVEGTTYEIDLGATWLVTGGTSYAGTQFRLATTGTITLGTTSLSIVQFSTTGGYTAGNGLSLVGGQFSVQLQSNSGLVVSGAGVAIDTTVVAKKQSTTITGDGSTTTFAVTHALPGGLDVMVNVYEISSGSTVDVDTTRTSTTNVNVVFASAPAASKTYRVVLMG